MLEVQQYIEDQLKATEHSIKQCQYGSSLYGQYVIKENVLKDVRASMIRAKVWINR